MLPVIILLWVVSSALCQTSQPVALQPTTTWDCGTDGKSIRIGRANVTPSPIPYPGNVTIDTETEVLKEIPSENLYARLNLVKLEPERLFVDCINGIGSCTYDVCSHLIPNNQATFNKLGLSQCPFPKKVYSAPDVVYQITDLGGPVFGNILEGNFEGNITFYNKATEEVYGCLGMKFAIKSTLPPPS